jgi:hypothetical protein
MARVARFFGIAGLFALAAGGTAHAGDMLLSGPDTNDGNYSSAVLQSLANGSDTVSSGGLTGISLWGLLGGNANGIQVSTPAGDNGKNAILRYYLVGADSGGNHSVVSIGEIDPNFGGTAATPAFVAFQQTGGALLTTPELIVPGGAGRNLTTLTSLQLASAAAGATVAQPQPSTAVKLTGNVAHPGSYNLAQLQALPVTQETVSGDNYTGVALWTFLASKATPVTDQIVVTRGTDNYEVVLSLAELDPALGGNPLNLLPYADTGTDFPTDGVARTIFPDDNKHGRWISNLDLVDVEAVPEPGTFALFAIAAASLVIAKRRKAPAANV